LERRVLDKIRTKKQKNCLCRSSRTEKIPIRPTNKSIVARNPRKPPPKTQLRRKAIAFQKKPLSGDLTASQSEAFRHAVAKKAREKFDDPATEVLARKEGVAGGGDGRKGKERAVKKMEYLYKLKEKTHKKSGKSERRIHFRKSRGHRLD